MGRRRGRRRACGAARALSRCTSCPKPRLTSPPIAPTISAPQKGRVAQPAVTETSPERMPSWSSLLLLLPLSPGLLARGGEGSLLILTQKERKKTKIPREGWGLFVCA